MARTPGLYVPLDANYLRDPAIRKAGPDAELLYIRGLAHAKSGDTDGLILTYDLPVIGVGLKSIPRRVDALVRECLWVPISDGWVIRSWERWNMTRDEREADKATKRTGAALTNHSLGRHADRPDPVCPRCSESLERSDQRSLERSQEKGREVRGKSEGSQREGKSEGRSSNSPLVVIDGSTSSSSSLSYRAGGDR